MSLTTIFSNDKEVKQKLSELFPKPIWKMTNEMVSIPLTKNYALIGTAFDYLFRFKMEHLNKKHIQSNQKWVATLAHKKMTKWIDESNDTHFYAGVHQQKSFERLYLIELIDSKMKLSKNLYDSFIDSGILTDELVNSALFLSKMDNYFRSGILDPTLEEVNQDDVDDLKNLLNHLDDSLFKSEYRCYLNPTFGEGSKLVGGADADIIVDDLLIDLKTTKTPTFERDYFNQLIGYYTISQIGGIGPNVDLKPIKKIGIYFSRYATLWACSLEEIAEQSKFEEFKNWLINHLGKDKTSN